MVRILQGSQLSLQQDGLSLFDGVLQIGGHIAHIGLHHLTVAVQFLQQILRFQGRFMIQMLQGHIFDLADPRRFFFQQILIKKFADLEADLGILVRIERSDAGFGGTEGFSSQALLLILVKQNMVGHHHLRPV